MELLQETVERLKKILAQSSFDYESPPKEAEGLVSVRDGDKLVHILPKQGVLTVFGKTGTRKTSFLTLLAKAAFTNEPVGPLESKVKGKIVWIDTEQSGVEFYQLQKKLRDMCGVKNTDDIVSHSLVGIPNVRDRMQAIDIILQEQNEVGLLIVDGIKDLLLDSNDESTSKEVIEILRSYTVKHDCGLITVLHTDKKGNDMVGRLGTLLGEKSSYALKLELDTYTKETTVSLDISRGKTFPQFRILHNDEGNIIIDSEAEQDLMAEENTEIPYQGNSSNPNDVEQEEYDNPPF